MDGGLTTICVSTCPPLSIYRPNRSIDGDGEGYEVLNEGKTWVVIGLLIVCIDLVSGGGHNIRYRGRGRIGEVRVRLGVIIVHIKNTAP